MKSNHWPPIWSCLLACLLVGVASPWLVADEPPAAAAKPDTRPNVLFIAVDDLNHWVGYLNANSQTRTPNIDKLAARGLAFNRSYCPAPVCNPSRAALLSGLRPGASGIYDNGQPFAKAISPEITLPSAFRKAGYLVMGTGKIYHGSVHRPAEWDDYFNKASNPRPTGPGVKAGKLEITPLDSEDGQMPDAQYVDYALTQLRKKHDKPLFLAVGLTKPHLPWSVPRKYYQMFPLRDIKLPPVQENDLADIPAPGVRWARAMGDHEAILKQGPETWKQAVQAYLATIAFCDAQIGRLIEGLDQSPMRDNTIICFWTDHGWNLGEKEHWRKFALWEETTRSPLIFVVPGLTRPGTRTERPVDLMSLYPTLTDLCSIPTPAHVQGKSLRPLLIDPAAAWDQPAITTFRQNNHALRTQTHRYIRYADGSEELYDHRADPHEWTNLASRPESAALKQELAKRLPTENKPPVASEPNPNRANPRRNRPATPDSPSPPAPAPAKP